MSGRVLQRLLETEEYQELEDVVIAEGEFVETDDNHRPIRQVILGMTPINLLIAQRVILNYKEHPEVYLPTDTDPQLDGLQLSAIRPICSIRMDFSHLTYELSVLMSSGVIRYYELTNTSFNGQLEDTWALWRERVLYLRQDPYGYVRAQFDEYGIPYPDYYINIKKSAAYSDPLLRKLANLEDIELLENELQAKEQTEMKTKLSKKQKEKKKKTKWFKKDKKQKDKKKK